MWGSLERVWEVIFGKDIPEERWKDKPAQAGRASLCGFFMPTCGFTIPTEPPQFSGNGGFHLKVELDCLGGFFQS